MIESRPVKPSARSLRLGGIILVVGFLSPLLIPVILRSGLSEGWKALISSGLAFGIPELFMLIAVAVMGKDGFNYFRKYFRVLIRRYGPPEKVSRARYNLGLVLFCIPLIIGFLSPYFVINWELYLNNIMLITAVSDVLLLFSLVVLGGEFWDKLRSLFIHGAKAEFPGKLK